MITYKSSGVNIDKANKLVKSIQALSYRTKTDNVVSGIGGFSAAFTCPKHIKEPVFLAATDGIGTKIRLANKLKQHDTVGIDLVAMCVNDILCSGGEPLVFLDYYATGKLDLTVSINLMKGIVNGCQQSGAALIGGETAEMPVVYKHDDWDLAGFCIGVVEREKIITGENISNGNVLIGIPSSGLHSNGFSLVNKLTEYANIYTEIVDNKPIRNHLLEPTKIYVSLIEYLIKNINILGIANITGGGIVENIPRILPSDIEADIDYHSIIANKPAIFNWLQKEGDISDKEMLRTFNCGIGMVICVAEEDVELTMGLLDKRGESGIIIGYTVNS